MEKLKLHSEGARQHLKAVEDAFIAFKENLKGRKDLTVTEKEVQLSRAKESFLEQQKQWQSKLF